MEKFLETKLKPFLSVLVSIVIAFSLVPAVPLTSFADEAATEAEAEAGTETLETAAEAEADAEAAVSSESSDVVDADVADVDAEASSDESSDEATMTSEAATDATSSDPDDADAETTADSASSEASSACEDSHTLTAVVAVEPTCVSEGNSAYYVCSVCGKLFSDAAGTVETTLEAVTLAATGVHSYVVESSVEASCSTGGSVTYVCSACGVTYTVETEATGDHDYDYEDITWIWTESDGGWTATATVACSVCGASQTLDAAVTVETVPATCAEAGQATYTATVTDGDGVVHSDTKAVELAATGEHDYVAEASAAATCGSAGFVTYVCSICGDTYSIELAATGEHVYVESWSWADDFSSATLTLTCSSCSRQLVYAAELASETVPATCTEDGYTTYTATVTDGDGVVHSDTKVVELAATGEHSYVAESSVAATCTESGSVTYVCSVCGDSYTVETEATGEHVYDYESIVWVWEESDGVSTATAIVTCSECGATITLAGTVIGGTDDAGDATDGSAEDAAAETCDHDYDYEDIAWTWTEADDGWAASATVTCAECGETLSLEAEVVATETTPATCGEAGQATYTASVEGADGVIYTDVKTVELPATGDHDYVASTSSTLSCGEAGITTYVCSVCGDSYVEGVAATGDHDYDYEDIAWTWTEADDGWAASATVSCAECGETLSLEAEVVATETTPATCGEAGQATYAASVEGADGVIYTDVKTVELAATGDHDYVAGTTVEATCGEAGSVTYTCSVCGDSYTEEIPATGEHELIEVSAAEATCTEDGNLAYFECEVCGALFSDAEGSDELALEDVTIEALGHDYEVTDSAEATCTTAGHITNICTRCGDVDTEWIAYLGHDYVVAESLDATCTENGYVSYACTRCGETYADVTLALGHDYEALWAWANDYSSAILVLRCADCGDVLGSASATVVASVDDDGSVLYSAEASYGGQTYATSTKASVQGDESGESDDGTLAIYEINQGADQAIMQGDGLTVAADVDAGSDELVCLVLDGEVLDAEDYQLASGSAIAIVSADCLAALEIGEHTLTLVYEEGSATMAFTIEDIATRVSDAADSTSNSTVKVILKDDDEDDDGGGDGDEDGNGDEDGAGAAALPDDGGSLTNDDVDSPGVFAAIGAAFASAFAWLRNLFGR